MKETTKKRPAKEENAKHTPKKNERGEKSPESNEYIAVIRIRGEIHISGEIADTMRMLKIPHSHNMAIYQKSPAISGMIAKVKDYVAFGEVSEETALAYGVKQTIKMHPPRGGFERKGVKLPYTVGGALGYRGKEIEKLIVKMKV